MFALLTDVDAWPRWNREIAWARRAAPLRAGAAFRWKSHAMQAWLARLKAAAEQRA